MGSRAALLILASSLLGACTPAAAGAATATPAPQERAAAAGPLDPPRVRIGRVGGPALELAPSAWSVYRLDALLADDPDAFLEYDEPELPLETPLLTDPGDAPLDLVLLGDGRIALNEATWTDRDGSAAGETEGDLAQEAVSIADGTLARVFALPSSGGHERTVSFSISVTRGDRVIVAAYEFAYARPGAAGH